MRLTAFVLLLLSTASFSFGTEQQVGVTPKRRLYNHLLRANPAGFGQIDKLRERRCAYLGRWGSFHLIGNGGSAAYTLGKDEFLADLSFVKQNERFWYYEPSGGDRLTTRWAFSKRPDHCGRFWVWRAQQGRWHEYEATKAWGIGLNEEARHASVPSLDSRVTDLEDRVRALEKKISP